jgi:hypothetical protein
MCIRDSGSGSPIRLLGENTPLSDFQFHGVTYNDGSLVWGGVQNTTLWDVTGNIPSRLLWQFGKSYNNVYPTTGVTFVNSSITGQDLPYTTNLYSHTRTVNTEYDYTYTSGSLAPWSIITYFPVNVKVVNGSGVAVQGVNLNFSAYNFTPLNSELEPVTSVLTGSDGRPAETIYLCDANRSSSGAIYDRYTINATYGSEFDVITNVNPQPAWKSPDLSDLQGDLITLTLDIEVDEQPEPQTASHTWTLTVEDSTDTHVNPSFAVGTGGFVTVVIIIVSFWNRRRS